MKNLITLTALICLSAMADAQAHPYRLKTVMNLADSTYIDLENARSGGFAPNFDVFLLDSGDCEGNGSRVRYILSDPDNVMLDEGMIVIAHFSPYHLDTVYTVNHMIDTIIEFKARLLMGFEPDSMISIKVYYTLAADTNMHMVGSIYPETPIACTFDILCFGNTVRTSGGEVFWVIDGIDTVGPSASLQVDTVSFINAIPAVVAWGEYQYWIDDAHQVNPIKWASAHSTPEVCDGMDGTAQVSTQPEVIPVSYVWDNLDHSATPIITGLSDGIYHATVTDDKQCTIEVEAIVLDSCSISTNVVEQAVSGMRMYPNPTSDWLTVNLGYIADVIITDELGRVVYTGTFRSETIDVSRFAPGQYILRDSSGYTGKFSVTR